MARLLLTGDDVTFFWWLFMLRVMTVSQIQRLRYVQPDGRLTAATNVRKRLGRLEDEGFICSENASLENPVAGRPLRVYRLGEEALTPLYNRYGIAQKELYRKRRGIPSSHDILVTECAARTVEGCRGTPVTLPLLHPLSLPFYTTHMVGNPSKKRHVERFVSQEDLEVDGYPERLRIRPDLVFALAAEGITRLFCLEADRSFEGHAEIAEKLFGYHHYAGTVDPEVPSQKLWQRYLPSLRDLRVLFVTTTERRVEELRKGLASRPGFELTAFTTIAGVSEKNPVLDEIWVTRDGVLRGLVKRPKEGKEGTAAAAHERQGRLF